MITADGATIIALSSGAPPAAIGIIRISGSRAGTAIAGLCGSVPPPRRASLRTIRHPDSGDVLDSAVVLWFPGPHTSTGEDLAEIHAHGGRAVISAILTALATTEGVRLAEPGEFTRRAFANGVIDLAQAEGLADLLSAETEAQRRNAQILAGGGLSRMVGEWQYRLLGLCARIEAILEFGEDEDDVGDDLRLTADIAALAGDIADELARPAAERLKDGVRVVLAGPPNAGKSTLLNALVEREVAITSPIPGTTRDMIQAPVAISGMAFLFVDTAGLREAAGDEIERRGVDLAKSAIAEADILLWLGEPASAAEHPRRILLHARCDAADRQHVGPDVDLSVSAHTGVGMGELIERLLQEAKLVLPAMDVMALNRRQRAVLAECKQSLLDALALVDPVLRAEELRTCRVVLDRLTGRAGTEEMLDALFGKFCIGK